MRKTILSSLLGMSLLFSGLTASEASQSDDVIHTAKQYIGVPYQWGGQSPKGFDCSGFLNYVFEKNSVNLPRTVAEIYPMGKKVEKKNLKKGDLVFYTTYKAGASHAGIYVGNSQFIHASSSAGITITSMENSYWKKRYVGAKRLLKEEIAMPVLPKGEFYDVPRNHWAYEAIREYASKGYINGRSNGMFEPGEEVTRAQAAVVIKNIFNLQEAKLDPRFKDVSNDHWARSAIRAVAAKGFLKPDRHGNFNPQQSLTRGELAYLIAKAYELDTSKPASSFKDVPASHWASHVVQAVHGKKIIQGFPDGTFKPEEKATRVQFVVVLRRAAHIK